MKQIISKYLSDLHQQGYLPNTIRAYKSALAPLRQYVVSDITADDVAAIIDEISTPSTAAARQAALKTFFCWARRSGHINTNPIIGPLLSVPTSAPTVIPPDDLDTILGHIGRLPLNKRVYLSLLYYRALKPSEAICIRVSDVDYDSMRIAIRGNYARHVPIDSELATMVYDLCMQRQYGPLFVNCCHKQAGYYWAYYAWRAVMQQVGLTYDMEHLRQTRIVTWLMVGITPQVVTAWAGHLGPMYDVYKKEATKCS